jgi:hypothetical protein
MTKRKEPAPEPDYTVSPAEEIVILEERIAELEGPPKVEYPKWVTDKAGARRLVQDADEHKAACGSLKE